MPGIPTVDTPAASSSEAASAGAVHANPAVYLVRSAPNRTRAAGTARIALSSTVRSRSSTVEISGQGVVDNGKRRGEITLRMPEVAGMPGVSVREVILPHAVYVKGAPGLPPGKWLELDLDRMGLGSSPSAGDPDPSSPIDLLRGSGQDVTEAGTQTVRGEPTKRYTGVIDLSKAVSSAPARQRALLRTCFRGTGVRRIPFELYLDAQGRTRKLKESIDLRVQGQRVHVDQTLEMFDFGIPVSVSAPPPGQVVRAASRKRAAAA